MGHRRNPREFFKYFELKENENTVYQNLQDAAKAAFRGIFTALRGYIRKGKKSLKSIIKVSTLGNQKNKSKLNPKKLKKRNGI